MPTPASSISIISPGATQLYDHRQPLYSFLSTHSSLDSISDTEIRVFKLFDQSIIDLIFSQAMMMKSGVSTLNPFAESYIPLAKRETSKMNEDYKTMLENIVTPDAHGTQKFNSSDFSKLKGQEIDDAHDIQPGNASEITRKKSMDEEFEMDLAYLQMTFPGVSDQSLIDVYLANGGDLEAAVDMLNHLESYNVESADNLPDALDIGDCPAQVSTGEWSSVKAKHAAGESSNSSDFADVADPS